ncbi:MAG: MotA/TolQ/ExbB proton channel family protein [Pseudomonadota bacterium]|nr:biopolymer transporter ExbB [Pseudomonadales bacterium]MDY6920214.1 MotA/TolQ/ExbB proton channel family protein [Pseudomonadota bacterium]
METNPYGIMALWEQGDIVIKLVAVSLLVMSVLSWYVILVRSLGLLQLRRLSRTTQHFWHARSLGEGMQILSTGQRQNPFHKLAEDGQVALDHHTTHQQDLHGKLPLADWLTTSLRGSIDESSERLQRGLSVLASVGSTAPFIGLFGTVWGIYHALVGIGVSGQASIDKVAGPVGEALIMTAFGLVVAIPAVLGYNALQRQNKLVLGQLNRFAHQLHAFYLTGTPISKSRRDASVITRLPRQQEVK